MTSGRPQRGTTMNATRILHRARPESPSFVALADFSEARLSPRRGEPVATAARNSAYDLVVAGPRVI